MHHNLVTIITLKLFIYFPKDFINIILKCQGIRICNDDNHVIGEVSIGTHTDPYLLSIRLPFPPPKMGQSAEPKETRNHIIRKI
jgi:hypothetical protein